jgi:putative nucleotidyltransferase with HDIG domain
MLVSLDKLIAETPCISALPQSTVALLQVIDDPTVGTDKLLPIVERDPGLTASLLKLCNSSSYGVRRQTGSVREALVLVGNRTFIRLAFALSLEQILHCRLPGYRLDMGELWRHSLAVACGTSHLVEITGQARLQERAFTAGLLHDIGKLVLDQVMMEMLPLIQEVVQEEDLLELERGVSGYDHAQAGALLLETWDFPEALVESIRCHHRPDLAGQYPEVAQAVYAANLIDHYPGMAAEAQQPQELEALQALVAMGIPRDSIQSLCRTLTGKTHDLLALALAIA